MRKTKRNNGWEEINPKTGKLEVGRLCKAAWMLATEVEPLAIVQGKPFHSSTINYVANKLHMMDLLPNKEALKSYIHIGKDASCWGRWAKTPALLKQAKQYQARLLTLAKTRL